VASNVWPVSYSSRARRPAARSLAPSSVLSRSPPRQPTSDGRTSLLVRGAAGDRESASAAAASGRLSDAHHPRRDMERPRSSRSKPLASAIFRAPPSPRVQSSADSMSQRILDLDPLIDLYRDMNGRRWRQLWWAALCRGRWSLRAMLVVLPTTSSFWAKRLSASSSHAVHRPHSTHGAAACKSAKRSRVVRCVHAHSLTQSGAELRSRALGPALTSSAGEVWPFRARGGLLRPAPKFAAAFARGRLVIAARSNCNCFRRPAFK
jgi:hypothetical protein